MKMMSSFTHPHVCLLCNTKDDILKNVGNQTVDGSHWLPYEKKKILWKSVGSWLPTFFKIILCSTEQRNSYIFGTTWEWV